MPTAEVCRRHGISSATFYKWESKFGGLEVSDARRLRRLEQDNSRLKKLLAEAMLDNVVLKNLASKKLVTPGAKREAVTHARKQHGLSERRACRPVGVSRRVIRYEPTRPDDGAMRNGFVESFNGRLRDECLNETLFTSLAHARFVLAAWQHDYNTVRPHSKLGGKTPAEIAGERVWGHAPRHVSIPLNINHEGARLYL